MQHLKMQMSQMRKNKINDCTSAYDPDTYFTEIETKIVPSLEILL